MYVSFSINCILFFVLDFLINKMEFYVVFDMFVIINRYFIEYKDFIEVMKFVWYVGFELNMYWKNSILFIENNVF